MPSPEPVGIGSVKEEKDRDREHASPNYEEGNEASTAVEIQSEVGSIQILVKL